MPNHRKPRHLHLLQGTWRQDRHGGSQVHVEPMDPEPPDWLRPDEVQAWNELAAGCKPFLAQSDRAVVGVAARLMAASRAGTTKAAHEAILCKLLDQLGASPAGRERLQPINAGVPAKNPFADL